MKFKITHEHIKINSRTQIDSVETLNQLVVAKNQTVSFQIIMDTKMLSIINTSNEMALTSDIDVSRFRVKVTSLYPTQLFNEMTLQDADGMRYADIISHKPYVKASADMVHAVWVDIHVLTNCEEISNVNVEIFMAKSINDEQKVFESKIELKVLNVELPVPSEYKIYLDLWQHNASIARYFEVPLWSDLHFNIIEKSVKLLSFLGQKSIMIIGSETPWNGWGSHLMSKDGTALYEHSIIQLVKLKDGCLKADFSIMQRYIDLCSKYGINKDISLYGLVGVWNLPLYPSRKIENYPETLLIRYYDESSACYKFIKTSEDVIEYLKLVINYFKDTNQLDKVRIAADEPKQEEYKIKQYYESISILKEIEPTIRFKVAIDKDGVMDEFKDTVSDICSSFPCTTRYHKKLGNNIRKLWYVCNIPDKPNTFLNSSLIEARVLGSLTYVFNYDGLLRWSFTCWTKNPRENIQYATQGFPVGDLNLVYPEENGDIAISLRYKALQRGIEDYEIIRCLIDQGKKEVVDRALSMIRLDLNTSEYMISKRQTKENLFSDDYKDYEKMRFVLLKGLE